MKISYGKGKTKYGTGVQIDLTGAEIATAIGAYLVSHDIHVVGPRTITVNGEMCEYGGVYIDPAGSVIADGERWNGDNLNAYNKDGKEKS